MDEQATLECALDWFGVGIVALCFVAIPLIISVPALRIAVGVVMLLVGLFAWMSVIGQHNIPSYAISVLVQCGFGIL